VLLSHVADIDNTPLSGSLLESEDWRRISVRPAATLVRILARIPDNTPEILRRHLVEILGKVGVWGGRSLREQGDHSFQVACSDAELARPGK
jgi:hypothetical protein